MIKTDLLKVFISLSALQSIIALLQFHFQHPVGLFKLGEQRVYPAGWGVAKIVSGGMAYIRGYGTFFHPNPLSAFLITAIFFNLYLLFIAKSIRSRVIWVLCLLINILGLTVTFSRAGFLAFAAGLVIFFGYLMIKKIQRQKTWLLISLTALGLLISIVSFKTFLLSRATVSGEATLDRITYAKIGLRMVSQHPLFGLGLGESVPLMKNFSDVKLPPRQIQPIHNYFLLSAVELGIPGALIIIWIFFLHLKSLILKLKSRSDPYLLSLFTILSCMVILMLFDHYFYTLQQTQMLLWLVLALIMTEIKKQAC